MNYSREDLLRYLSGQMPASEMHALEKAALEDPFLADALEGLQLENAEQSRKDFSILDKRLTERTDSKVIPMPATKWWRVAIAAALIGLMGIASYFFLQQKEPEQVIAQKTDIVSSDTSLKLEEAAPLPDSEKIPVLPEPEVKKSTESLNSSNPKAATPEMKEKDAVAAANSAREAEGKKEVTVINSSAGNDEAVASQGAQTNKSRQVAPQRSGITEKGSSVFYYNGQVTNLQQQPVPFANISIRDSRTSTYADARGYFRLVAGDSSLLVEIKSVGYQSRTIQLSKDQPQQMVILQAEPESKKNLSARTKQEALPVTDTNELKSDDAESDQPEAEPRDGLGSYQIYLLNNVRVPVETGNARIYGFVEISFLVDRSGKLSEFRVEKGLCPACDKEAIRLVKEGPPWVLYNSEFPIRTRVRVVF